MQKKNFLAKILIVFGLVTLLTSLVDILAAVVPPHLANSQWVYGTAQEISERSIIPILGIVLTLLGIYLENGENKPLLNLQRALGIFSALFGLGLITVILLFALSMNSIKTNAVQQIKEKSDNVRSQVTALSAKNPQLAGKANEFITKLDKNVAQEIKSVERNFHKRNLKTLINLILFAVAYLFTGVLAFRHANIDLRKLRFKKSEG